MVFQTFALVMCSGVAVASLSTLYAVLSVVRIRIEVV
jgi:hypothetical protein